MKTGTITIIAAGILIAGLAITIAPIWITAANKEVTLRNGILAQQQACEAYYDKLWKVLQQKAGVADQYKEAFAKIYPSLISGRYQDDQNLLFKFVTESNPQFDAGLYKDLSAAIEGERTGFFMEQKRLIDLDLQHKVLRQRFPSNLFVGSRPDVPITIVTSDQTEAVFAKGKENDIELFKRDSL